MGTTRRSIALTAVALFLSCAGGAAHGADAIKIGLLLPFKGVYAPLAEGIDKAWQLALSEAGGKAGGSEIKVIREDSEANPAVAVQKAEKLIRADKVNILAGAVSSGVGVALNKLATQQKKPLVLTFAVADVITAKMCSPYVARTSFSANAYEAGAGVYWAKQGMKTAVTLGPDYAAGHAMIDGFKRGFESAGGKVIAEEWSAFRKTKDWGPYLTKIAGLKPDMIYSFYGGAESIQVVKQHASFGLKSKIPLMGDQWLYDQALWDAMGNAVVGARYVTVHTPDLPNEASKRFVAAFEKKFGAEPDVNVALGYDNIQAILMAIDKLHGQVNDGKTFIKTLAGLDYESPRGRMHFNSDNNAQLDKVYLVEVVRGADGKLHRKLVDTFPGGKDLSGCKMKAS